MPTIPPPKKGSARLTGEPHDPITEAANVALEAAKKAMADRGLAATSIVVLLDSETVRRGGGAMHRDDGDVSAAAFMTTLLIQLRAIARANGQDLDLLTFGQRGEG